MWCGDGAVWGCVVVGVGVLRGRGLHKVGTRYSPVKLIGQVLYEGLVGWRVGKD